MPTLETTEPYRQILVSMAPEAPTLPDFPVLSWSYTDGLYGISEADVDKLLDYGENALPLFTHRYDQYLRQMRLLLDALAKP